MSKSIRNKSKPGPKGIYMDYASSVLPNPSSIHSMGVRAKKTLNDARDTVASVLGATREEVIFTSGGTESNNIAIQGVVWKAIGRGVKKPHIVSTNIEHPSVLETLRGLKKRGIINFTLVPVEENGIISPKKIKLAIKPSTVLVSVMYANNEIGTIQPIKEIAKEIRHYKKTKGSSVEFPLLHTDAVQAVNYLDINVERLGVDLLSISGTKIKNAGRVGLLFKKRTINISPLMFGGDQEMGLRPGTENLKAIKEFANSLIRANSSREKEIIKQKKLQKYFISQLKVKIKMPFTLNGDEELRLPNNINITFGKIPSDVIVLELSERGIMTSPQSACKSSRKDGSYVIQAINKNLDPEIGGVRFSFGEDTKKPDIDKVIKSLKDIFLKLEKWYTN